LVIDAIGKCKMQKKMVEELSRAITDGGSWNRISSAPFHFMHEYLG